MRRLILFSLGRRGGFPADAYQMAFHLLQNGCILTCYVSEYAENISAWRELARLRGDACKLFEIKTFQTIPQFLLRSLNIFTFIFWAHSINRQDASWLYIPGGSFWDLPILSLVRKKRILYTLHDPARHEGEKLAFSNTLTGLMLKMTYKVIVLSRAFVDVVATKYRVPRSKICYIKLGNYDYYVTKYHESREIYRRVLFFGRIVKYKGLGILLKAMEIVWRERDDIMVRIAGNGVITEDERLLIGKHGDKIEYINQWISDERVQDYFRDIDITVLPYTEATQSGIIPLSYTCGRPVIVSDVGALSEQIYQDTGWLTPARDPERLARAILDAYSDTERLIRMRVRAKEVASTSLSRNESAKELLRIIEDTPKGA